MKDFLINRDNGAGAEGAPDIQQIDMGGILIDLPPNVSLEDPGAEFDREEAEAAANEGGQSAITEDMLQGLELPEGIAKQLTGKSIQEVLKSYANAQVQIGKLGNQIGLQQQQLRNEGKRTSATATTEHATLLNQLAEKESALSELDELVDGEDWTKLNKEVETLKGKADKLKTEAADLKMSEMMDAKFGSQYNNGAFEKMRNSLKQDFKMDFEDNVWDAITEKAKILNGPGQITPESMESAVMMTLGAETYRKTLITQGEQNMREKLKTATSKEIPLLTGASGKGKPPLKIKDLAPELQGQVVKGMEAPKFIDLYQKETGIDLKKLY